MVLKCPECQGRYIKVLGAEHEVVFCQCKQCNHKWSEEL